MVAARKLRCDFFLILKLEGPTTTFLTPLFPIVAPPCFDLICEDYPLHVRRTEFIVILLM